MLTGILQLPSRLSIFKKSLLATPIVLICFSLSYAGNLSESAYAKAIYAHLKIRDYSSANLEAVEALHLYPSSKVLWQIYIKTLAKQGDEKEMLAKWKEYTTVFPEEKENRELTEEIAWGVVEKASNSSSPIIRLISTLSAFLSQDARGLEILLRSLKDNNSAIRGAAVELSGNMRDNAIQEQVYNLYKNESVWGVRMEAIRSLGRMKMKTVQNDLVLVLQNAKTSAEESAVVVEALVSILDTISRPELERLIKSDRSGLRLLACELMAHFDRKNATDLLIPLLEDHHADVRKAALWTLGYLRVETLQDKPIIEVAKNKLNDIDPEVGLKATWLLTLHDPYQGQNMFKKWLKHPNLEVRITAAAQLVACGKYGFPLIAEEFNKCSEPYVRANLALGLIGQRQNVGGACQSLYECLKNQKDKWSWDEKNHMRALVPNKVKYSDFSHSPESVDQVTRLEILNILAILKFPLAQDAIRSFLKEKNWGITAMAAATLLTEGDDASLELVQNLLKDEEMRVRVQAALILALWGGGDVALSTLEQAFPIVDREMKEHILEGIAKISSPSSIPFLLKCIHEPNQSLRVIAAAGLLMSLYH